MKGRTVADDVDVKVVVTGDFALGILNAPEVDRAVRYVTETGCDRSRAICPVDTSRLVRSLETDYEETPTGLQGQWGTDVHYGKYVENGHFTTAGTWVPPQSFLRAAATSLKGLA